MPVLFRLICGTLLLMAAPIFRNQSAWQTASVQTTGSTLESTASCPVCQQDKLLVDTMLVTVITNCWDRLTQSWAMQASRFLIRTNKPYRILCSSVATLDLPTNLYKAANKGHQESKLSFTWRTLFQLLINSWKEVAAECLHLSHQFDQQDD